MMEAASLSAEEAAVVLGIGGLKRSGEEERELSAKRLKRQEEVWSGGWESAVFYWSQNLVDEAPSSVIEHGGRIVTSAEKELLEVYEVAAKEEAAEQEEAKQNLLKQRAAVAVKEKDAVTKRLQLAQPSISKTKIGVVAGSAAAAAVAAAARAQAADAEFTSGSAGGAPSETTTTTTSLLAGLSVPKRAKKAFDHSQELPPEEQTAPENATAAWNFESPFAEAGIIASDETGKAAPWISTEGDSAFFPRFKLPQYGGNNTLVLEVTVAPDADRWALNLCPLLHDEAANILCHMNPRRVERGGVLVLNDKLNDEWLRADKVPLADLPPAFGLDHKLIKLQLDVVDSTTLFVNATIDDKPLSSFKSRLPPPPHGADVIFLVSTKDDFGNPEAITIHKAWWGWHPTLPRLPLHLRPHNQRYR